MPSQQSSPESESPHVRWKVGGGHTPARRALPNYRTQPDGSLAASPASFRYGQAIRARRRELNWAQWELADEVGLSRTSIANIENGRVSPTVAQLVMFSTALNMDPLELLRRALEEEPKE